MGTKHAAGRVQGVRTLSGFNAKRKEWRAAPNAWCYICGTAHLWEQACPPVPAHQVRTKHAVSG